MTAHPLLLALGARTLYVGPAFGLTAHANAVSLLACGLDGPFRLAVGDEIDAGGGRMCRSAFISAGTLLQLACGTTRMAFLYVDAQSLDDGTLRQRFRAGEAGVGFDAPGEAELLALLSRVAEGGTGRRAAWEAVLDLLQIHHEKQEDVRIRRSIQRLAADPGNDSSLMALSADAGLSESRYLHLFKQTTGVTLRRYRQWVRMGAATRAMARGQTLTDAALGAGFSSSSHFSAAFREMFGMAPSGLSRLGLQYERAARGADSAGSSPGG